jgi:hypothetical protein
MFKKVMMGLLAASALVALSATLAQDAPSVELGPVTARIIERDSF